MIITQLFSNLKVGKFLIHGSLLIYEDPITGVLRSVHLESKQITLFDAQCLKEVQLPLTVWGLCFGSKNTLLHCWGGNLRVYSLDSKNSKEKNITRYNKAYLSKARAILIHDANNMETEEERDDSKVFCEHMGFYYCTDSCTLLRVSQSGKCESVTVNVTIVCMYSCPLTNSLFVCDDKGHLYKLDTSTHNFPLIPFTKAFFVRPRQILHHQSLLYVLDSRGLWILGPTCPTFVCVPHVLHFSISSSETEKLNLVCREFNNVVCISVE